MDKALDVRAMAVWAVLWTLAASLCSAQSARVLHDPREVHLANVRQLTFEGENAEAYWSPDGRELIFQSTSPPYACDQIFRLDPERPGEKRLVSTGQGRTTCAYFSYPAGERILYASTHGAEAACPEPPDRSQGYVWPIYPSYEIYSAFPDGSDVRALTQNDAYDAEATVCPIDGSILFTSTRDGDLDLYRMDADGGNVARLTDTPGYDGGAFFSADCSQIVWRASRPAKGEELEDYRRLLARDLVRPGELEIWVADADGDNARQVTYLGAGSFAPFFAPSGRRILFSTNYGDPRGREFDIWAVDVDGSRLERITYTSGFDGFPMFSPDGRTLAFASNRNQGKPGETDVYVARWVEGEVASKERGADRLKRWASWLADDARQGRALGSAEILESARWLAERFAEAGLEPGAGDGFMHRFEAPVSVASGAGTRLVVTRVEIEAEGFRPLSFSTAGAVSGEVVAAGYGISAPEHGRDDYAGLEVEGKIVVVRRFAPPGDAFAEPAVERRFGDLRYKAWNAREHGAVGVIVIDLPEEEAELPEEAPLPRLRVSRRGDAGIPAVILRRDQGATLFGEGDHRASLAVELEVEKREAFNVVARLAAGDGAPGETDGARAIVIGGHYDHLGLGGRSSMEPDAEEPHNGADDNASGTAALVEIGRQLVASRQSLLRDIYLVAFSGEESGLLGSTAFTRHPPAGLEIDRLAAMLNLDMVGRLRRNELEVLGGDSAEEWADVVPAACERAALSCELGGDGYGPSDQTPFYAAGVPVLHFFTGTHEDYHKPSDDIEKLNLAGLEQITELVADIGVQLASTSMELTYKQAKAPEPRGDVRSYGASLGTIPDYAGEHPAGVLLAGVRPGGAAEAAGMKRGDLLVELAEREVRDLYDMMFVLRRAKPGETTTAVVERGEERLELTVTYGKSRRQLR